MHKIAIFRHEKPRIGNFLVAVATLCYLAMCLGIQFDTFISCINKLNCSKKYFKVDFLNLNKNA
jgi:hypothetical protein